MSPYEVRSAEWDAEKGALILDSAGEGRRRKLVELQHAMQRDIKLIETIIDSHTHLHAGMNANKVNALAADEIANAFRTATAARRMLGVYAALRHEELTAAKQPRTARGYLTATRRFIDFNHGYDISLDVITSEKIVAFQTALLEEGVARTTVSFYMRTLRAIYNKAVAESIVPPRLDNPFLDAYTDVAVKIKNRAGEANMKNLMFAETV
jgi:hypothetical protein